MQYPRKILTIAASLPVALAICLSLLALAAGPVVKAPTTHPATAPAHPFRDNVRVEVTDELLIVKSNGIPDHETGNFPTPTTPTPSASKTTHSKSPGIPCSSRKSHPRPWARSAWRSTACRSTTRTTAKARTPPKLKRSMTAAATRTLWAAITITFIPPAFTPHSRTRPGSTPR